jgi:hypothetical protein
MIKSKNEEWEVYIVLLQEAEKTFIECAELEFCNHRTHSWPRETSYTRVRARERTSTAKSLTSVITGNMKSSD